jgi:hypothetical protein
VGITDTQEVVGKREHPGTGLVSEHGSPGQGRSDLLARGW